MDTVFGRQADLLEVEETLQRARHGFAALVLEGDAGIGKTSVWRAAIARAAEAGSRVLSCRTAPAEARLSFAALGDLLAPVEGAAFDALPAPQRRALDAALLRGESRGAGPNPRAIGTGLVGLLQALAASRPLLVAIDDAQWLDAPSAHALEFALRRLDTHPVALLATRRIGVRGSADRLLAGERVRALRIGPPSLAALYRIIEARLGQRLPRPLLARIERASAGNPFYALEIARALGAGDRPAAVEDLPIPGDLSELVTERLRKLPRRTREALLRVTALAQPTLEAVGPADLEPAEEAGIVRVDASGRIELTHPLYAHAIYGAAPRERRRRLHAELAEAASELEERARHLVLALVGEREDPRVAAVLDQAAEHALRRGAPGIAAEFSDRAARLTRRDDPMRTRRQLRAAQHSLQAGDPEHARALCDAVLAASPPDAFRAEALHRLAEAALADRPATAIPLLEEALRCVHDDVWRAAQLESALGAVLTLVLDLPGAYRHLARAVELAVQAGDTALAAEAIAMREAAGLLCGKGIDEAELSRALAWEDPEREAPFQMRASLNVACAYEHLARFDAARVRLEELRARAVARGDEADLPWLLCHLAAATGMGGDTERGEELASEAERAAALTGSELFRAFALVVRANLRAIRGSSDARADADEALAISTRIGWPIGMVNRCWALGMLALSEGDPAAAWAALAPVVAVLETVGIYEWPVAMAVPDAIEALVATGDVEPAQRLAQALQDWGRRFDRPWALATAGRCRALLASAAGDLEGGTTAAREALVAHERLPFPFEEARTLLVLGRLQRRRGERREARATLERAVAIFERIGARLWLAQARAEIARIGVRRAPEELTESEQRVAELAASGLTNPEIAARLFMSRRTVEANLARAYRKLDIRSRAELGAVMAARKAPPSPS